jgi:hypothetical protein
MSAKRCRYTFGAWVFLTVLIGVGVPRAEAYYYKYCKSSGQKITWFNKGISWRAGKKSFANTNYRTGLERANTRWNDVPGNFTFKIATWSDGSVRRGNGQNEVWFSKEQNVLDGSPALCYRWFYCFGGVTSWSEADVIFDVAEPYSPFAYANEKWGYGGAYRPFVTTAIHEMGHALGLGHENRTYNIMGDDWTHVYANGDSIYEYAGEDGSKGLLFLYGTSKEQPSQDLGVTHWKYGGKDGEYSEHVPTVIYDVNWNVVSSDTSLGFPRYHVKAGQTYNAEFTLENNGTKSQYNIKVGHYISTNRYISTFDPLLGGFVLGSINPDWVSTQARAVALPSTLKTGQTYWLGIVIDDKDELPELYEANNAAYLPIQIVP